MITRSVEGGRKVRIEGNRKMEAEVRTIPLLEGAHEPRYAGRQPREAEKDKKTDSSPEPPERM